MRRSLILLSCAVALLVTACGGGSTKPVADSSTPTAQSTTPAPGGSAPADEAAAKAQIKANWTKFFAYRTKTAVAESLIEGGAAMAPAMALARQEQKQTHLKQNVKVNVISFTSPTSANVTYALLNGTAPLLPNASGVAVYMDGKWLVSKASFCTLVQLGANGKAVPGCA